MNNEESAPVAPAPATLANFAGRHEQGKGEIERQRRRIIEFEQRRKVKSAYYADVLTLDELTTSMTARQAARTEETVARPITAAVRP